ncbi:MAG: DNA translocase FtsK 4TM domain-containing protein [Bacteroidetes bacterium]|nr:DNA translocase FtsK 4TM domain-containing protein [Bacteroidota bacterium]MBS1629784.1 DNA translocase FtsK 4TM domain-containing protein [Bacteroidota bacterium]
MAASRKTASSKNSPTDPTDPDNPRSKRLRQLRLFFGLLFLVFGSFTTLVIISYFFSWQADQDLVMQSSSLKQFILHGNENMVANWGGRLGAAWAHLLFFRGAGIASLALGLWAIATGLNIVKGKRISTILKYLRWSSLLLLLTAPILAFILPHSSFPWGGAWGTEAIAYSNGLIGAAGTGLVLLAAAFFVFFVIFALDIAPMLRRARRAASKIKEGLQQYRAGDDSSDPNEGANADPEPEAGFTGIGSKAIAAASELSKNGSKLYDMTMVKKEVPEQEGEEITGKEDEEEEDDETRAFQAYQEEETKKKESARTTSASNQADSSFSFEVVQQAEQPAAATIKHGGHISIESGEAFAPELDLPEYKFPTLDLLEDRTQEAISLNKEELEANKAQIEKTLNSFGITIQRIAATVGPTVTLYEIVPTEGVRISKIRNLEDDIALNLAALGIRIIAPIPGKGTIGIEVPNANKQIVSMRTLLSSDKFVNNKMSLPIALGKQINNENYIVDLATMPHLLMAGATGQGKSVGINAILVSLLFKKHPSQLKFVLVDPKKVELSIYRTIEKHFLAKLPNEEEAIITDNKKVINTLNALCIEMDNRYELLKEGGARNIREYNEKFIARRLNPEKGHTYLPFIVLVVDEFADLIMTAGKEVEMPIARLAQLARAVGIHLIVATQRPSVNVITGTIKANFPARIAFKVSAKVDSRTILDSGGAEQLIGRGDMLVSHGSELLRLQCAFVDTPEVEKIVSFIGRQRGYPHAFELPEYVADDEMGKEALDLNNLDKLFKDCARVVVSTQSGSTSNLQRKFNLGYNRAGRIMDQLESAGIVGPAVGSKPREVLYSTEMELEQFLESI